MSEKSVEQHSNQEAAQRDKLLLRLLKTPPQPRPKRERDKSVAETDKEPAKKRRAKSQRNSK